ncbi:MAG: MBL fold metallo-hydrolase [Nitrospiraceae bacterium]|nr:MBL fold metallo-hydrolase [Nitrospiraceae bacterium]
MRKGPLQFQILEVGPLAANCIIAWDGVLAEGIVVDPGDEPGRIMDFINGSALKVKYIVCTHAHFDHVGAVPEVKAATGAPVAVHEDEMEIYGGVKDQAAFWGYELDPLPPPDVLLKDGDAINIGAVRLEVMHTPGHSPGGICIVGYGAVFSGDTLFNSGIGRTDGPGCSHAQLMASIRSKLLALPDKTVVLPGHGPGTTIGQERMVNPFLR